MARALLILASDTQRATARRWLEQAPPGSRIEFKGPVRTLPQSAKMWAMLTDVATQKEHCGRRYVADDWKILFMHALGREARFIPALDGHGFIPIGQSSSDLSKEEMSDLIEFMTAWGAEKGVEWTDPALPPGLECNPRDAA
jgi:hypothetical protein